jgi:hypothetical protein
MKLAAVALVAACGGSALPPAGPSPTASAPATPTATLADLGWLAGQWHSPELDVRWQLVAGALYGISLTDTGFEVTIIDDNDDAGTPGPIVLTTWPSGGDPVTFPLRSVSADVIELGSSLRFTRTANGLQRELGKDSFTVVHAPVVSAPELEASDRTFAIESQRDGSEAWIRWFAPDGAMWRGTRITGVDPIRAAVTKTLDAGPLAWVPVASGIRGKLGFTLGTYTFGNRRGSYCTIWKQTVAGWRIAFDVGRPEPQ